MTSFFNHYKPLILIFAVFFGLAYIAITIEQKTGREHKRALKQAEIGDI